jgi:hypothetical protein
MTGTADPRRSGGRWRPGLPGILLAAVVAAGCSSCVVFAVQLIGSVPEMIPPSKNGSYSHDYRRDPPSVCRPTDPVLAEELHRDPLIVTPPPNTTSDLPRTLESCGADGGGIVTVVRPTSPTGPESVAAHYRPLLLAGGWTVSDPPAEEYELLSATRAWRDRSLVFSLFPYEGSFWVTIEMPRPTTPG